MRRHNIIAKSIEYMGDLFDTHCTDDVTVIALQELRQTAERYASFLAVFWL